MKGVSEVIWMLVVLVLLSGAVLAIVVSAARFQRFLETHSQERMAAMLSMRITGSPGGLAKVSAGTVHKNVLDIEKVRDWEGRYKDREPDGFFMPCYRWQGTVHDYIGEPVAGAGTGSVVNDWMFGHPFGDYLGASSFKIPVAISRNDGSAHFGYLEIWVSRVKGECEDDARIEKDIAEAQRVIDAYRSGQQTTSSYGYISQVRGNFFDRRCEELEPARIRNQFKAADADLIKQKFQIDAIERASDAADVDSNAVRAVMLEHLRQGEAAEPQKIANLLRDGMRSLPAGDCSLELSVAAYRGGVQAALDYLQKGEPLKAEVVEFVNGAVDGYGKFRLCRETAKAGVQQ